MPPLSAGPLREHHMGMACCVLARWRSVGGRDSGHRGYRRPEGRDSSLEGGDVRALAASILVAVAMAGALCGSAAGGVFKVYTCTSADDQPLGPTIGSPGVASGW